MGFYRIKITKALVNPLDNVKIMLETYSYVDTQINSVLESVRFSIKNTLILLTSAFLPMNQHFLAKVLLSLKAIVSVTDSLVVFS